MMHENMRLDSGKARLFEAAQGESSRPMRVHLIGDAGRQKDVIAPLLPPAVSGIEILPREAASSDAFDGRIGADDVVITLRLKRSGQAPAFRLLHVPGAGLDGIDFDRLAPSCRVCNVFEHEVPIAEYVLGSMLNWRLGLDRMRFTAAGWGDAHRGRVPHGELAGSTVGIVGFGRIGREVARRAQAFGMRVATLDRRLSKVDGALVDERIPAGDLPRLLGLSDFVVLACPLNDATRGMIDREALAAMKPSGVLVNVSRAEIADETALYEALRDRVIAGAVLDVWYRYPAGADDNPEPSKFPFLDLPNVVATPHASAWTENLPGRRYRIIAENIRRLAAGEPLLNQVWPAETAR